MYPQVGAALIAASRGASGLKGGTAPRPPRPARPDGDSAGAAGGGGGAESAASNGARSASVGQRNSVISSDDPFAGPLVNTARRFRTDVPAAAPFTPASIAKTTATIIAARFVSSRVALIGSC